MQTERSGFVLTAYRVEEAGRNLVLHGLKITFTGQDLPPLDAGDLTLEGVEQRADGGYTIERIAIPDIAVDDDASHFFLRKTVVAGCQIAAKPEDRTLGDLTYCRSFTMGPAEIGAGHAPPLASLKQLSYTISDLPDDSGLAFAFLADGLTYNFEALGASAQNEAWQKVGLPTSQGRAGLKGRWTLADGRLALEEGQLALAGFGRVAVGFDISGYTLDALCGMKRSVDHAVTSAREAAQKPSTAAQVALLQAIGRLALNRASFRFEDGGLTKRLFAFLAETQKLSPAQLIAALKIAAAGEAPKYAPILGKPLANAILKAVDAYLSDPRSLTLTLAPASPVPAGAVLVAAQSQPEKLAPMLGLSVQAND
ncbi:hypothetical protein [Methylobacterium gossipiicola]|uniref:Uncharacterized protein n=1 Tax=Methylobacterium gossipiicola TaxID=582675 RepID=A0A1I2X2R1_9HYPH|nr:hypothetical protein [Methylobacterium gossipiicola]SFH07732.1 hypothetical protein SAMN05192565_13123 [Methylobacterium gossipiicola]